MEYPKVMTHPTQTNKDHVPISVTVESEEQEEEYLAKGYRVGFSQDPMAFAAAATGMRPPDFQYQAYPKWKYHAKKPACIVEDREEEDELGEEWYDNPAGPDYKPPVALKRGPGRPKKIRPADDAAA